MAQTVELNYNQAHKFVEDNKSNGFFWDGYTIVKWSPGNKGFMQTNGMFRNNMWGYASKFPMTNNGTWKVLSQYVRNT